ncbi:hypothetical protein OIU79_023819 [Salix purpurea]|uniref:Uncharacterized protein n=1 Tax=Salix purpurea TaxID=77065 RepID=A0A9Q1A9S3_SALPP|nr:hypothetical protein OIU79_023819 [Salix purpurea]
MAGILHKIEGAFGGKKEEQGKGEPHAGQQGHNPQGGYGQQGHNPQGGYGQEGHNAQGERKEGFVEKFKEKIPGNGRCWRRWGRRRKEEEGQEG